MVNLRDNDILGNRYIKVCWMQLTVGIYRQYSLQYLRVGLGCLKSLVSSVRSLQSSLFEGAVGKIQEL